MRHLTNRARFLCAGGAAFAGGLLAAAPVSAAAPAGPQPTPDEALRRLTDGNRRYMADAAIYCNRNYDRRLETAKGQMPFAIVLSCSDSRVPAEIVFDQRVGDLFLVRVAGNIAEPAGIASIEYAVSHFHSPLLMVVGHESCGAVEATLDSTLENVEVADEIAMRMCARAGLEEEDQHKVEMAVHESMINAVRHGNKSDASKKIWLRFEIRADRLEIHIRDEGTGFDVSQIPDPLAPENLLKVSGRGIFLIRTFMDEFRIEHPAGSGTEVTLIKRLNSNQLKVHEGGHRP